MGVGWVTNMSVGYPDTAWFFGRRELKRLKQTTLVSFFEYCADVGLEEGVHFKYNAQDSLITFINKSKIYLLDVAYQPRDPLFMRFGSMLLTGGFIDESADVPYRAIDILSTRVGRWKNGLYNIPPKILETFNPDKGHVYSRFHKPDKNGTLPAYRSFTRALPTDNPYLPESYITQLRRADKTTRERMLEGNFDYDDDPSKLFEIEAIHDLFTNSVKNSEDRYLSVDVARFGDDKTIIWFWKGMRATLYKVMDKSSVPDVINAVKEAEKLLKVRRSHVVIDEDGVGGGVVDGLPGCRGFVNNSSPLYDKDTQEKPNYANLKTQCYFEFSKLVEQGMISIEGLDETTKQFLVEELEQVKQKDIDKEKPISLVPKEDIKANIGRSPDYSDALMMRMIYEVKNEPTPDLFVI